MLLKNSPSLSGKSFDSSIESNHRNQSRVTRGMSALAAAIILVFQASASQGQIYEHENYANKSLYWTDSQGRLLKHDLKTGQTEVLFTDCTRPYGIVMSADGKFLYFSDTSDLTVVEINCVTGATRILCRGIVAYGLALGRQNDLFVTTGEAIHRIDLRTGTPTVYVPAALLRAPVAVDVLPDGRLLIADLSGSVVLIGRDGQPQKLPVNVINPVSVVAANETTAFIGDSGAHVIIKVNLRDGSQEVLAIPDVVTPVGLALLDKHTLIIGDPDANGFAGGIFAFDLRAGTCTKVFVGEDPLVNPRCVTVGYATGAN